MKQQGFNWYQPKNKPQTENKYERSSSNENGGNVIKNLETYVLSSPRNKSYLCKVTGLLSSDKVLQVGEECGSKVWEKVVTNASDELW